MMTDPLETDPGHNDAAEAEAAALHASGERLILSAFDAARRSGRGDWRHMTVAVLKNRILAQDGDFSESDWGARTVQDFVSQFPELLTLDRAPKPPVVELREDAASAVEDGSVSSPDVVPSPSSVLPRGKMDWQVRPDLWRAILGYEAGSVYVWDGSAAVSVSVEDAGGDTRPRLPTITALELQEWKADFAAKSRRPGDPEDVTRALDAWQGGHLPDAALPARLRTRWVVHRKRQVRDRLVSWFASQGIGAPADLAGARPPSEMSHDAASTEQLRELAIRCVRAMTRAELEELRLSPAVLLRGLQ